VRIGELEKILGLSRETIRYYEKEGLINPQQHENRYREYSDFDIARLKTVIVLRKIGISISDIHGLFDGTADISTIMKHNIEQLKHQQEGLSAAMQICDDLSDQSDIILDPVKYYDHIRQMERDGKKFMTGFRKTMDRTCSNQTT
jgi:DNA-binding transcriptional MerR regulator